MRDINKPICRIDLQIIGDIQVLWDWQCVYEANFVLKATQMGHFRVPAKMAKLHSACYDRSFPCEHFFYILTTQFCRARLPESFSPLDLSSSSNTAIFFSLETFRSFSIFFRLKFLCFSVNSHCRL
jgi:hypothetical protein